MAAKGEHTVLDVAGREVRLSNPAKIFFPYSSIPRMNYRQLI